MSPTRSGFDPPFPSNPGAECKGFDSSFGVVQAGALRHFDESRAGVSNVAPLLMMGAPPPPPNNYHS